MPGQRKTFNRPHKRGAKIMPLDNDQIAIAKAMLKRGDYQHNIAAHLGCNPGRIAEIATGQRGPEVEPAPQSKLPGSTNLCTHKGLNPNTTPEGQYEMFLWLMRNPPRESRVIKITPALAELILEHLNLKNRKRRTSSVRIYSAEMENGNWGLSGDTIKFCRKTERDAPRLLDGQNRLAACVRSGVPFETHVVFGIEPDVFDRIDSGKRRT